MSETTQEPVIEQTDESMELEVGSEVNQNVPVNSKVEDESAEMETLSVNYLDVDLFDNIRKVSIEELLHLEVTEEVPQEEQDRYLSTFSDISEREIITGRVIGMNEKEILIDIGFKSEGIIKRDEFAENALPEVGEKLDVYLERMEDESGKTVLSKEKADFLRRWTKLREIHETGEIISGRIVRRIKGGMVVDLDGVQAFLPGSQIDVRPVKDFDKDKKRVSLGLKQLTPHPWENVKESYPEGTKISGKIVSMTNYGAFVEIEPGIEGLIHVSEMSWTRHVKNPSEMFSLGEEIDAIELAVDTEDRKISLGAKQLQADPWDQIEEKYIVGTIVKGEIINVTQFGAFVELEDGIDGLIHVSDLSWTKIIRHPKEIIDKGKKVEVRVLEISRDNRRIALGLKQIKDDPWPELAKQFETGKEVEGEVVRVLDKGIILILDHDVEGIIPFSRQTKRQRKAHSLNYKPGQKISSVVIEVKPEDKKVILFKDELSSDNPSKKDDVQDYLNNQESPATEKIEIPTEVNEETESEIEAAKE